MENNNVTSFLENPPIKLMYQLQPLVFGGLMKRHHFLEKKEKRTIGVQCNLDKEKKSCEVGVQCNMNVPEWVMVDMK